MSIRRASDLDLVGAATLRWNWVCEMSHPDSAGRAEYIDQVVAWARENSATHLCFVAEVDGELVGTAWLAIAARVPSPGSLDRKNAELQGVYVAPAHRNTGIGSELIAAAVDAARSLGVERTIVHSSEDAVRAYERAGFAASPLLLEQ